MLKRWDVVRVIALVAALAVAPCTAGVGLAQEEGAIAGLVTDTTGAILPGVTVEAASPALIEKVRTVVTDGSGRYRIVDLRPGEYTVTFSLAGFSSRKSEGVRLTSGFTATVNAQLTIGDIAETITVSGASPLVDIQNVNEQRVMTREMLDAIPSGRNWTNLTALVPGMTMTNAGGATNQDVGGMTGFNFHFPSIHGGRGNDGMVNLNGAAMISLTGPAGSRSNWQDGTAEEYVLVMAAQPAEIAYGGVFTNIIPKEGANRYSGTLFGSFTTENLQSDNLDADLNARGLLTANKTKALGDVNPTFGGPLIKDKLWFYTGYRFNMTDVYVAGLYHNLTPKGWAYTPDLTRPAVIDQRNHNTTLNLTWQVSPRNKLSGFFAYDSLCLCHFGLNINVSPEAATYSPGKSHLYQGIWTSMVTPSLLVEGAVSHYYNNFPRLGYPETTEPSLLEQATNRRSRSGATYNQNPQTVDDYKASVSYITGRHALKAGMVYNWEFAEDPLSFSIGNISYRVGVDGRPNLVTYRTTPYSSPVLLEPFGLYAQDKWTIRRATLNLGLRYDQFKSSYDDISLPPVQYLPVARTYPGAEVLNWKDVSPRFGVSYDVFGTGRTAVKGTFNRFVQQEAKVLTNQVHPVIAATNSIDRTWTDLNNDFVVQGDPLNPLAHAELGPSPNNNFGKPQTTLRFDEDWAKGFGTRPMQWEGSVTVQHQIVPRASMEAAYFHRSFGNFVVTDNLLVSPSQYDPFCFTTPVDARLPGGGGQRVCDQYDIKPSAVGQVDNVRTYLGKYGDQTEVWQGMDLSVNARLWDGFILQGGASGGKTVYDNCDVVVKLDNPSTYQCHRESPMLWQAKFIGSYTIPWQRIQISGAFQSIMPDPAGGSGAASQDIWTNNDLGMRANYVASNAVVAPGLGRNLAAGAASTVTINLVEPGTVYGVRSSQLDLRLAKIFRFSNVEVKGMFDMFNVFNANPVLSYNINYTGNGATWNAPQSVLPGRLIKFGAQMKF